MSPKHAAGPLLVITRNSLGAPVKTKCTHRASLCTHPRDFCTHLAAQCTHLEPCIKMNVEVTICTRLLIQRFEYDLNPSGSAFYLVFRGIRGVPCFSGAGGHRVGDGLLGTDAGGNTVARGPDRGNRQNVQGCRQKVLRFGSKGVLLLPPAYCDPPESIY